MGQLPAVVLSGLRQSGKSTRLQNEPVLARGHACRTLDGFAALAAARANPESLLAVAAVLAYNGKEAVKLDDRLWAVPMGHLLE